MYKISLIFLMVHPLYGCSVFGGSSNDSLYNAFEDDFFESLDNSSASGNYENNIAPRRNENMQRPSRQSRNSRQSMNNAYSSEYNESDMDDNLDDMYDDENNVDASIVNNFSGDNYIFSFSIGRGESLKARMKELLEPYGYKLVWKSELGVYFENDVLYEDRLLVNILKNISSDLLEMGIDIHINVYLKNKVVLVYSVRS